MIGGDGTIGLFDGNFTWGDSTMLWSSDAARGDVMRCHRRREWGRKLRERRWMEMTARQPKKWLISKRCGVSLQDTQL